MLEVVIGEYYKLGKLEYWKWFFPHSHYDPVNNGRVHLIGKFYWKK